MKLRIATRGSELALAQARFVAGRLREELGADTELVPVKTTGDRFRQVRLAEIGGKGLFIKELQEALRDGRADLAVHSGKDLPADLPAELALVAFPQRADPRDALVARERGATLMDLPRGARVATGSVRRGALLLAVRPDLKVVPIRGNVHTRLRKLEEQELDALILACAGLDRLGLSDRIEERIAPERMLPAVTQGALAIETHAGTALARDLAAIDDPAVAFQVAAERGFQCSLEGDCHVPLAAYAELDGDGERIRVRGLVASLDGKRVARASVEDQSARAADAGRACAEEVRREGGGEILDALHAAGGA